MKKILTEIFLGMTLLCLLGVSFIAVRTYRMPLAPTLSLDLSAAAPTSTAKPIPTTASSEPTATVSQKTTCGMSGVMTILVIGRDNFYYEFPAGADAIRYVQVNFDQPQTKIFNFQRDLYLPTPSLKAKYGFEQKQIGPLYIEVRQTHGQDTNGDLEATRAVAQTLIDNFGVAPAHYLNLNKNVLWDAIDTMGGIEVVVPQEVNINGVVIKQGKQNFDGKTAQLYMRYLPNSEYEWTRFSNQNIVLLGLLNKITQPGALTKFPELYKLYKDGILTDLSPEQILGLACLASHTKIAELATDSIPLSEMTIEKDSKMILNDANAAKKQVEDFFNQ